MRGVPNGTLESEVWYYVCHSLAGILAGDRHSVIAGRGTTTPATDFKFCEWVILGKYLAVSNEAIQFRALPL